jgi:hypothetical protein
MTGYHATIKVNALSILKDKIIKKTDGMNSIYGINEGLFTTTSGYVHLATTINRALEFGLMAWSRTYIDHTDIEREIYVFEVYLDKCIEIDIDEDEVEINAVDLFQTKGEIIQKTGTFRLDIDLSLGKEVKQYSVIKFNNLNHGYELLDNKFIEKHMIWKKITI